MLIDRIMNYCDLQYQSAHTDKRCIDCKHTGECSRNCKDCLEEVHYPFRYPHGKKSYDCPNLVNFYVCDYTYKYATEVYYLLQQSNMLMQLSQYRIFSIGCGACPDLMAFEAYVRKNQLKKTIEYRGIDKNPLWEPVHEQISQYTSDSISYTNLGIEDVFTFLEQYGIGDINVLVLQYIISALYTVEGPTAIDKLFDLLIDSIVRHRNKAEPFVIIINDVNSNNLGRDLFIDIVEKLKKVGISGTYTQFYFDKNIKNPGQKYGIKHENCSAMNDRLAQKYQRYEPWRFCTSAQLLIEIGGDNK